MGASACCARGGGKQQSYPSFRTAHGVEACLVVAAILSRGLHGARDTGVKPRASDHERIDGRRWALWWGGGFVFPAGRRGVGGKKWDVATPRG